MNIKVGQRPKNIGVLSHIIQTNKPRKEINKRIQGFKNPFKTQKKGKNTSLKNSIKKHAIRYVHLEQECAV